MRLPAVLMERRGRFRLPGIRTLKLTLAAVLAYSLALPFSDSDRPMLAPLTALLVVQLTLYDTVRSGLRRVVSVVAGVLIAVVIAEQVPLTWWSLGLIVGASLVTGQLLRLRAETLEVPISAMLVLALGGSDTAASERIVETIVGAVVGVTISLVIAPPLYLRPATEAVHNVARETAEVLRRMSTEIPGGYTRDQARAWLDASRALSQEIRRVDGLLGQAEDSLRMNPRAVKRPHAGLSLRTGLDGLERTAVSLRSFTRSLADTAESDADAVRDEDLRRALGALLSCIAEAVDAYGALVSSEVVGLGPEDQTLRDALTGAWEERRKLGELVRRGDRLESGRWQVHGNLLVNIDQLLRDLDSEARAELRRSWPPRPRPSAAMRAAARSRLERSSARRWAALRREAAESRSWRRSLVDSTKQQVRRVRVR